MKDVREKLINVAFMEIYQNGYQGTGLNQILEKSGVTKGALYHYFRSKKDLVIASYTEIINKFMEFYWKQPLENSADPLTTIREQMMGIKQGVSLGGISFEKKYGCPLNNLIQEMAPNDIDFQQKLDEFYSWWANIIAESLERGIKNKTVRGNMDPSKIAFFIISAIEGCISNGKVSNSDEKFADCLDQLADYLETLRYTG